MWINKRRWSEVIARLERLERARGTRDARAVAGPEREEKMGEMLRRHFRLLRRGAVGLGYAAEYRVAAREGGGYSAAPVSYTHLDVYKRQLYKGGRCSALAALGANLLHLKPCIEVRNGRMGVGRKYRGAYEKVLRQYAHDRLHGREDIDRERAFITWSTCPQPALDAVRAVCREEGHFEELLETQAGCTVCNHCGPNTLGVLFVRKG